MGAIPDSLGGDSEASHLRSQQGDRVGSSSILAVDDQLVFRSDAGILLLVVFSLAQYYLSTSSVLTHY